MTATFAAITPGVVTFLSWLTLLGQAIALGVIVFLLTGRPSWFRGGRAERLALPAMLIVALVATGGSLFFSELAGWAPCKLCWFQRIFMYPQVLLLGWALWKRDRGVAPYSILLSAVGLVIALYHYAEQVAAAVNPPPVDQPCDPSGISCAAAPFFHFGYVTIPLMAATAFALLILGAVMLLRRPRA